MKYIDFEENINQKLKLKIKKEIKTEWKKVFEEATFDWKFHY